MVLSSYKRSIKCPVDDTGHYVITKIGYNKTGNRCIINRYHKFLGRPYKNYAQFLKKKSIFHCRL